MTPRTVDESLASIEATITRILNEIRRLRAQKINLLVAAKVALPWVLDGQVHKQLELAIEDAEKDAP